MVRTINTPIRSARPTRNAAKTSRAINNLLIGSKRNIGTPVDFSIKKLKTTKRNRNIKIKELLSQPKQVQIRKNGQVIRKMTVRRKSYFPGRRRKTY